MTSLKGKKHRELVTAAFLMSACGEILAPRIDEGTVIHTAAIPSSERSSLRTQLQLGQGVCLFYQLSSRDLQEIFATRDFHHCSLNLSGPTTLVPRDAIGYLSTQSADAACRLTWGTQAKNFSVKPICPKGWRGQAAKVTIALNARPSNQSTLKRILNMAPNQSLSPKVSQYEVVDCTNPFDHNIKETYIDKITCKRLL